MKAHIVVVAALAALACPALAAEPAKPAPSPGEIVSAAPAGEWRAIVPADLLVMDLAPDPKGKARRVVIQLMPAPFSQGWVGNLRKLAAAHWWDGTSVYRVQDNYVTQWGDADGEDKTKAKPLPAGLAKVAESEYVVSAPFTDGARSRGVIFIPQGSDRDAYGAGPVLWNGWAFAGSKNGNWPVHCYGMVGVARDLSPDTGTGAELYTVIGHAPRALDRNIALVGRVIEGMQWLSSLPRGPAPMGVYTDAGERTPIVSVRLGSELAAGEQPRFEYLSTESETFARYADAIANRRDPFFIQPAGGADVCSIRVPIRRVKS